MKKIYESPATLVVRVELQQMIAGSVIENGFDLTDVPETTETSGNLSRKGHSVWDDEEEEEELY